MPVLYWIVSSQAVLVIGLLIRVSYQSGSIVKHVQTLEKRIERLEKQIDRRSIGD